MKKLVVVFLILMIPLMWLMVSSSELGEYDTFEEAIAKDVPYKVKEVVYTEKVDGLTIVMYTTEPDEKDLPLADFDALGIAFLKGNNQGGWGEVGPNNWNHYENPHMTIYHSAFREGKGDLLAKVPVTYGEVNNAEIQQIETKEEDERAFSEATIIEHEGKRYYFDISYFPLVRGLSSDGEIISQQG